MSEDHGLKSSCTTEGDTVSKNKIMTDIMPLVEHLLSIRGLDSILITEEKHVPLSVCLYVYVYVSGIVSHIVQESPGKKKVCQIGKYSVYLSSLSKG